MAWTKWDIGCAWVFPIALVVFVIVVASHSIRAKEQDAKDCRARGGEWSDMGSRAPGVCFAKGTLK